ncbi:N-acetylgalactosaminyltransferase 6-like [Macrosteles quadrilineatus]|uniref:N-acetylgalactosaminyltransferase 6-like n=1 Tax=Macrosteles quadrilineatus TaxID=74068 RepID=UPI0023E25BFE|nr:N-acetylgalactosaminyltransferase 6-like [Macrosteles quadrilineatus]
MRGLKRLCCDVTLVLITVFVTVMIFNFTRPNDYLDSSLYGYKVKVVKPTPHDNLLRMKKHIKNPSRTEKEVKDHTSKYIYKVDWHDYRQIDNDEVRSGNGEHGKPATLPPTVTDNEIQNLYKVNGFNALLSDHVSLNRSLPDIRKKECQRKQYRLDLPSVSVIVPFHNEHWSTLLRTAWSVVNRSPSHLLKEIILVDDFSSKDHCKKPLDDYVAQHLPKVKVIHLPQRDGLIRARLAGAKIASGQVLVVLDSHIEANINWLPPLLEPIAEDYRTCVCPLIDIIDYETFAYSAQDEGARGAFDWEFYYKRLPLLPEDLKNPAEPFRSPVMAGGLFAISAKFFWELGGYDPGLTIWGGEQYELSFKIWQCGGRMFDAPCSRVGHIYRKFAPFPNPFPNGGNFVARNFRRVAEVWMDEYAEYLYMRQPHIRSIDPGDLTEQKAVRERLQCKPFRWFMEEVAFDLVKKYPVIEPPHFGFGEIRNGAASSLCIDTKNKGENMSFGLDDCISDHSGKSGEQEFLLTWRKDVRTKSRNMCWDVSAPGDKAPVLLYNCHGDQGNQMWRYDVNKKWLVHGGNLRCLDTDLHNIFVSTCDPSSETQHWHITNVNYTALANWDNPGPQ